MYNTKFTNFAYFKILLVFVVSLVSLRAEECPICPGNEDLALNSTTQTYLLAATMQADESDGTILSNQRIKIINLGPIINHEGFDYAPTVSADGRTLYYVSNRPGSKFNPDGKTLSHDFWAAKKNNRLDTIFFEPFNIDTEEGLDYYNVNSELNEGAASIAPDRQSLYFTACLRPDGLGDCDIYFSRIEGEKWQRPVNLGKNVNSEAWDSQPSISPDGKRLYFVSNRKGPNSRGPKDREKGADIWYSDYDDDLMEWGKAKNLEAINTKGRDVSPFIAADNVTLFFASDGHTPTLGGKDFYVTRYDPISDSWSKPENLGAPINTKEDEQFITLPASGDIIYFSSTRQDVHGAQGSLDVYMAFVPSFFRAVNVIITVVDECSGESIPASVELKNPLTDRLVTDNLTTTKTSMEVVISNTDYGNPKDSIKFVNIEVSASNPTYGSKSIVKRIDKPGKTEDPDEAQKPDEVRIEISLGQPPVINAEMEEAEYIKRAKINSPELAAFRGLVMEEVKTWDLYPLLNYVFFDKGSSTLPDRYNLFDSNSDTRIFTDTTIRGGTLDKYYHILNIYGYRLNKYPDKKIKIIGTNDGITAEEKNNEELSKQRATLVYNYLRDIWNISEDRMDLSWRGLPEVPTSTRIDSIGVEENRRVEIISEDWEVIKPVFDRGSITQPLPDRMEFVLNNGIDQSLVAKRRVEIKRGETTWNVLDGISLDEDKIEWDWMNTDFEYPANEVPFTAQLFITTKTGAECVSDPIVIPVMQVSSERKRTVIGNDSTRENYSLILFPFDRFDAGPLNERIMKDYVYDRSKPTSVIEVIGHTDVVGMFDHNKRLSEKRSETVKNGINKETGGRYGNLNQKGVGEEDPLYTNELPEGRFYNRTVQVLIRTPLSEYDNE